MLMAGNGYTPTEKMELPTVKLQPAISIPSKDDGFMISQSYPPSTFPTPLPLTSHVNSQPGGGSSSNKEISIIRQVGPSTAPTNHLGSPIIGSIGSASKEKAQPGTFMPSLFYTYTFLIIQINPCGSYLRIKC